MKVRVKVLHGGAPYVSPTDLPAYRAFFGRRRADFGRKPVRSIRAAHPCKQRFRKGTRRKVHPDGISDWTRMRSTRRTKVIRWPISTGESKRSFGFTRTTLRWERHNFLRGIKIKSDFNLLFVYKKKYATQNRARTHKRPIVSYFLLYLCNTKDITNDITDTTSAINAKL